MVRIRWVRAWADFEVDDVSDELLGFAAIFIEGGLAVAVAGPDSI